jgi:hypothetical protein
VPASSAVHLNSAIHRIHSFTGRAAKHRWESLSPEAQRSRDKSFEAFHDEFKGSMSSMADSQGLSNAVAFTRKPGEALSEWFLSRAQVLNREFLPLNIRTHLNRWFLEGTPAGKHGSLLDLMFDTRRTASDFRALG